jgi:Kef-type K+ transport system membrane component KefB
VLPLSDPILVFAILVLVMLVAPLAAERLRVPDLVLLLGAGAALGPNGLGLLARDSAVTLFGSVGLLYVMFLAGLEIDLHRFARARRRSILFGVLTFAVPQGLGTLAGRYILGFEWTTAILLASMFASHTLLAYPIASRLGIARSEPVTVTVGATILTDTLALLVLVVIADSARGLRLGAGFWAGIAAGMAALVVLTWWGIPWLTRRFFACFTERDGAQFLFVIATVCGCAYLSHFARMEPIIGAFLAGAAFSRLIPERSVLMNRVAFVGNTLFIPFFLISVGMLVDPGALVQSPRGWLVAATMAGTVIATKYAAAFMAGKLCRYDADSRRVMFGLSVVQAAATLAAVLVGYDLKIFDGNVLNGAILMIMVTCPLGSWVVDRYGRRLASRVARRGESPAPGQRLLVTVANPSSAPGLLDLAFMLRDASMPGAINLVTIVRDEGDTGEAVARGEAVLARCLVHASAADMRVEPSVRVDMNVSDGISRAARELRSNTVLAGGGSDRPLRARIFGTVVGRLLETCPPRLIFCRLVRPLNTTRRILLPLPPLAGRRTDFASLLHDAKYLSRQAGADLRIYLAGGETAGLRQNVEAVRPTRPLTFVAATSPAEARDRLLSEIGADDMILFPAERRGSALWTPVLDRLPEVLAVRFPENNMMIAYPAIPAEGYDAAGTNAREDTAPFVMVPLDIPGGTGLDNAISRIATAAFPGAPDSAAEARHLLRAAATAYPVELGGAAVLLHAHCGRHEAPVVVIGCGQAPWDFPGLNVSSSLVLALLCPEDLPPETHLRLLAELARRFHDGAFAGRVKAAGTATAVCQLVGAQLKQAE